MVLARPVHAGPIFPVFRSRRARQNTCYHINDMRSGIRIVIFLCALAAACGGVNTSKNQRRPDHSGSAADDPGSADAGSSAPSTEHDDDPPQTDDPPGTDAAAPQTDAADPDAGVPAGSFAAGTDLETTADLNLREGESTDFPIIVVIPQGTRVKVETTSGASGWVHLNYNGTIGYASKTYLQLAPPP